MTQRVTTGMLKHKLERLNHSTSKNYQIDKNIGGYVLETEGKGKTFGHRLPKGMFYSSLRLVNDVLEDKSSGTL